MNKLKKKIKKVLSQKGVALIWVMIVSTIMLIFASTMAVLMIKELRTTTNIDKSAQAYSAAESGIERALAKIDDGNLNDPPALDKLGSESFDILNNSGTLDTNSCNGAQDLCYWFDISYDSGKGEFKIVSRGESAGVVRQIEYIKKATGTGTSGFKADYLNDGDPGLSPDGLYMYDDMGVSFSENLSLETWLYVGNMEGQSKEAGFGLSGDSGDKSKILVVFSNKLGAGLKNKLLIRIYDESGNKEETAIEIGSGLEAQLANVDNIAKRDAFRVKLDFLKGIAVRIRFYDQNNTGKCFSLFHSLEGKKFNSFKDLVFYAKADAKIKFDQNSNFDPTSAWSYTGGQSIYVRSGNNGLATNDVEFCIDRVEVNNK